MLEWTKKATITGSVIG